MYIYNNYELFSLIKLMKYIIFEVLLIFVLVNKINTLNQCNSCQQILFSLKNNKSLNCLSHPFKEECMSISNKWHSMTNEVTTFYKNNQINSCETCYRMNFCHINECQLQSQLIKNIIHSKIVQFKPHFVNIANQIAEETYITDNIIYFGFIFNKIKSLLVYLKQFEVLYQKSNKIVDTYEKILIQYSQLSNVKYKGSFYINEDIESKWKDIEDTSNVYKEYFTIMKNSNYKEDNKVFLSSLSEIMSKMNNINGMKELQEKLLSLIDKAGNVTEIYKEKVKSNIELCNIIRKKIYIIQLECYDLIQEKEKIINDNQIIGNITEITNFVEKCQRELNNYKENAKNVLSIQIGKKKMRLRTKKQHNNMINQNTITSVSSIPKVVFNQVNYVPMRPILLHTGDNHYLDVKDILEEINVVSGEQDNPNQINPSQEININSNQPIQMNAMIGQSLTPLRGPIKVEVPLSTINSLGDNVFQPHKSIKELAQDLTYSKLEGEESTPVFIEKNQKKFYRNIDKYDFYSSVENKINQLDNEFADLQKSVFSILDS